MKILIIILTCVLFTSCLQRPHYPTIVTDISTSAWLANKCVYFVTGLDGYSGSFIDNCGKFTVGDTIYTIK